MKTRTQTNFASVLLILFIITLSGCAHQKVWTYRSDNTSTGQPKIMKSVSVPPFKDERPDKNSNMAAMYLIPLMPYGWMDLSTPEGAQSHANSGMWMWRPNEDLAKAAAEELNNARLFKEAFYTTRAADGDLALLGTVKSTDYHAKLLTYGLSAYGPLFWLFGLPASTVKNQLLIVLTLEDRKTHAVLWQKEYKKDFSKTNWIYSLSSDFEYSNLTKSIMMDAIKDLSASSQVINGKLESALR